MQQLPTVERLARVGDHRRPSLRRQRRLFQWVVGSDPQPTDAQVEELERYLVMGDPLADAVVKLYKELPGGRGRALLDQALAHGIDTISEPPRALAELFAQVDREPIWLDRDKLALACQVSRRVGPWGELSLRNLSLMGGYLGAAAAKPLVFTGQLERVTPRRLVETGKFWMDVTTIGGLERFSEGFKSSVRVRIMHAQVRAMLLASGKWDPAWGHPLNQADSMATILEFSSIYMFGLRALGFLFSRREREAIVHLWRYVGYLMGVDERILPTCEDDANRAMYLMAATLPPSDDDTRALGTALADVPLQAAGTGWLRQRLARVERTLRIGYTRYVLGDHAGDALGLPRTVAKYVWPAQVPLRLGFELVRASVPPVNRLCIKWGERLAEQQFPRQIKQTNADTSFSPVTRLSR
ncbi:MAG: DUF2236 domain-containing protein [Myxococcales bacterium]|nr:DUF2236 domain-containing protein [Myxococcales bacterium]